LHGCFEKTVLQSSRVLTMRKIETKCPSCGHIHNPPTFRYRWHCPNCSQRLRLGSTLPFVGPMIIGGIAGFFVPDGVWPTVVYFLIVGAILIVIQRALVRHQDIILD
jgi:hypothetical protein